MERKKNVKSKSQWRTKDKFSCLNLTKKNDDLGGFALRNSFIVAKNLRLPSVTYGFMQRKIKKHCVVYWKIQDTLAWISDNFQNLKSLKIDRKHNRQ